MIKKFMIKKGKAQASVITITSLIVLSLIAIIIVYNVINPILNEKSSDIEKGINRVQPHHLSIEDSQNNNDNTFAVTISRDVGGEDPIGFRFGFEMESSITANVISFVAGNICYVEINGTLDELETKTFIVPITECPNNIIDVVSVESIYEGQRELTELGAPTPENIIVARTISGGPENIQVSLEVEVIGLVPFALAISGNGILRSIL